MKKPALPVLLIFLFVILRQEYGGAKIYQGKIFNANADTALPGVTAIVQGAA